MKLDEIKNLKSKAKKMAELCCRPHGRKTGAMALAHCQVDKTDPLRFFVMKDGSIFINPKIIERKGESWSMEGCMSFPYLDDKKVRRAEQIKVTYLDLKGEEVTGEFTGLIAYIFQHEIDHFNGVSIYSKK